MNYLNQAINDLERSQGDVTEGYNLVLKQTSTIEALIGIGQQLELLATRLGGIENLVHDIQGELHTQSAYTCGCEDPDCPVPTVALEDQLDQLEHKLEGMDKEYDQQIELLKNDRDNLSSKVHVSNRLTEQRLNVLEETIRLITDARDAVRDHERNYHR